jgi:hypothetical protein
MDFDQRDLVLRADAGLSFVADLTGLPDFQAPLAATNASAYAPFGTGTFAVVPQALALATNPDGNVKLALVFEQQVGDFSSTGQYAVLDFSLAGDYDFDGCLAGARGRDPNATVKRIAVNRGFARLFATAGQVQLPDDLLQPVLLGLSGSDFARFTARISATAGELVKGAMAGGSLLFGARVEFDALGVAPRADAIVAFSPGALIAALTANATGGHIAGSDLLNALAKPAANLPLKVVGGTAQPGDLAAALAARICAAYGTLVPAPSISSPPYVSFATAQLAATTIQWDLSLPELGARQWVVTLDLSTSLRALASSSAIDGLVRYVSVPQVPAGEFSVQLSADLPSARTGVAVLGANVEIAANPPARPSSIASTVTFAEPDDEGTVQFRIGPAEQLAYTTAGFAVITAGTLVRQYDAPPRARTDPWVQLYDADFPVKFATVAATQRLLVLANVHVAASYELENQPVALDSELTVQHPATSIAIPRSATACAITISATPQDGTATLTLAPVAPETIDLDFTSFPEFGPHTIAISAKNVTAGPPLCIDLLAQEQRDVAGAVPDQRFFTFDQLSASWGYVASSPFCAGYCYRFSATAGATAGAWSDVQSPFVPLVLEAAAVAL